MKTGKSLFLLQSNKIVAKYYPANQLSNNLIAYSTSQRNCPRGTSFDDHNKRRLYLESPDYWFDYAGYWMIDFTELNIERDYELL